MLGIFSSNYFSIYKVNFSSIYLCILDSICLSIFFIISSIAAGEVNPESTL